ncbi:beta-glucosidase [Microbacterium sp. RURRCA19A]|uniref:beta-glucosidase family protein n=1 Tax=Microbacterium sp. RURRCA19A TaxID=1907391 RepID=UPI00095673B4|nr:glycoside hydrolase family 3 C-terminal domain-containing protein [Microbacterium sp. RURRCA19A]SIS11080.1 beta-glucosidase [Microbacterium sp. RURRCA19A]
MSTTTASTVFASGVERIRRGALVEEVTEELLGHLEPDEKLWLLDGDDDFWSGMAQMSGGGYNTEPIIMGRVDRLGIPGLRFSDGPRVVVVGRSTAFPVSMARGATWDVDLEERIGRAIGAEMRAQGANFFGGVCINLPRHPAWGRAQETYGEDSLLLGELGAALTRGVRRHAMAVAKHYALNSMENARFTVDVTVDEATLHEVYLPHFRRVVEEGVDGIMTAYNSVNGEWAGQNEYLMEDILRGEWGFTGVTVSDFIFGLRDPAKSLAAGLDVEEPFRQQRAVSLRADLDEGRASWGHVDRAARRILATQLAFFARDLDPAPDAGVVFSDAHRALAREAAATAAVLLKNEPVGGRPLLPLSAEDLRRVAVIGRLADLENTGDGGSSNVRPPHVVTPLRGLREALPDAEIDAVLSGDTADAARAASAADVAVVVVGYTAADEGEYMGELSHSPELMSLFPPPPEGVDLAALLAPAAEGEEVHSMGTALGGDRRSLRLRPDDVDTIRAVAAANPRTIVAIVTAGAVVTEEWRSAVPAVLLSWYAGSEGGHALADVLLGRSDAAGRLPYSIPTSEDHLPFFDMNATSIEYDRWHGQRLLDRDGIEPAFPLGFGLSYTTFAIAEVEAASPVGESFAARVKVANTGSGPGRHVVQLYARVDAPDFPVRVLVGFAPVHLAAGEERSIEIVGSTRPLQRWSDGRFHPVASTVTIEAAAFSGDPDAASAVLALS